MKISKMIDLEHGWRRFDLNVGGFSIRGCRWHPKTGRIRFPKRYDWWGTRYDVIFVYGQQVKRLRALLESGKAETLRDRRPCTLKVRLKGVSKERRYWWEIFHFTVRGFTVLGCRWEPETGSIQLPVTFQEVSGLYEHLKGKGRPRPRDFIKKPVVCAYGAHILRLRDALEREWTDVYGGRAPRVKRELTESRSKADAVPALPIEVL